MSRKNLLSALLLFLLGVTLTTCAAKEEDKDIADYVEEEMMLQLVRNSLQAAPACLATQSQVRFHNNSGTAQSLAFYPGITCTGFRQLISATVANGAISNYVCVNQANPGHYFARDGGADCTGVAFMFTAGNRYTVTSTGSNTYVVERN